MLGRVFALSDAEEQAEFLNEAGRTLRASCRLTDGSEEMQYCRIHDHLDADGKNMVRRLFAFIDALESKP